ncbi:MAG: ribose-phosphate pyrophosphokinase [Gammaproteobacteria bacterium]|nr:MAG: ribose-phosphate pyrophosphokinase [Gammaproteobacteria bacterium]RTZ67693.1 MAG: ribose-phosphate pyrophosphokinase [Aquificaceae bacterium]
MLENVALIGGSSHPTLNKQISEILGIPLTDTLVTRFSDGEIRVQINESVREKRVFVIQSLCHPANDNIMEALLLVDAAKRASAKEVTLVIPYYAYARQDRKDQPRVPISAKVLANLIESVGTDRIIAVDLHAEQIQGFFNIPVEHITAIPLFAEYLQNQNIEDLVIVSPDAGGAKRASKLAKKLGAEIAIIYKMRPRPNAVEVFDVIGNVEGKNCVIIDDIVDTAGTLVAAAEMLLSKGAKSVRACITHGVLSGPAVERINNSKLTELVITDSIPTGNKEIKIKKVLPIAPIIAEVIRRVVEGRPLSILFE